MACGLPNAHHACRRCTLSWPAVPAPNSCAHVLKAPNSCCLLNRGNRSMHVLTICAAGADPCSRDGPLRVVLSTLQARAPVEPLPRRSAQNARALAARPTPQLPTRRSLQLRGLACAGFYASDHATCHRSTISCHSHLKAARAARFIGRRLRASQQSHHEASKAPPAARQVHSIMPPPPSASTPQSVRPAAPPPRRCAACAGSRGLSTRC